MSSENENPSQTQGERLQKILSRLGIASRRQAEDLITQGEVTINGKVAKLGDRAVFGKDAIKVSGKLLVHEPTRVYIAFHKPRAVLCAMSDPEGGRPALGEYLSRVSARVYPVGRMDFMSEGLLLLTNDGDLTEKITKSPSLPRVYHVKVKGHPNEEMIDRIRKGAKLMEPEVRFLKPHSVRVLEDYSNKALVEVVVLGNGAFDVKALFEARGFLVEKITRDAIGQVGLRDMKPGEFRYLELSQVQAILDHPELKLKELEREAARAAEHRRPEEEEQTEAPRERDRDGERPRAKWGRGPVSPEARGKKISLKPPREWGGRGGFSKDRGESRGFGGDRDRKPRSEFGGDRERRPRSGGFGGGDRDRKPRGEFGGDRERRPRSEFGGDRERRPRSAGFGGDRDRKPRGDFGGDRERRPRSAGFGDKPRFGGERSERRPRSEFGGDRERRPRSAGFGAERSERRPRPTGSFGRDRDRAPRSDRGAERGKRPSGGRAGFSSARPSSGARGRPSGGGRSAGPGRRSSTKPKRR